MTHAQSGCLVLALSLGLACRSAPETQQPPAGPALGVVDQQLQAPRPESKSPQSASAHAQPGEIGSTVAASAPRVSEMTIPSGTTLSLTLENSISSDNSEPEDPVRAHLNKAIVLEGKTVLPIGTVVTGTVVEARQSGRVKGRAELTFRFDRLRTGGSTHEIRTARISREAEATKGEDAKKIGIGAGAVVGALTGGKKGAAIGGAVGAGAGTGVVVATRGEEVRLGAGAVMTTRLEEPVRIPVAAE